MAEKKKQVLFLARLYYPHIGGVERHIAEISKILTKKNYEVTVVCERHDKTLKEIDRLESVKILRIPIGESERHKKFFIWKWILKNRKLIKNFDIIHIHDVFYWIFPILFILDRKKIFITFHGYESFPIRLSEKIQKKIAARYCSGSIAVGEFINKWYKITSNAVIYGGVNRVINAKLASKKNRRILFYGRLDRQTGIRIYEKAYNLLQKKGKDLSFAVIGEGDYRLESSNTDVSPFKSDLRKEVINSRFIFVSRYLSMLEAMAHKRLVIAVYDDEIKRDYLVRSPFRKYVDICSTPQKVQKLIDYYLDNPRKETKRIEEAYKWVLDQNWNSVVSVYEKIWKCNSLR